MSLHCSRHLPIARWTLTYELLGDPRLATFYINYDEAFCDWLVDVGLKPFNDRVQRVCNGFLGDIEQDIHDKASYENTFDRAFNRHKYGMMKNPEKKLYELKAQQSLKKSIITYEIIGEIVPPTMLPLITSLDSEDEEDQPPNKKIKNA